MSRMTSTSRVLIVIVLAALAAPALAGCAGHSDSAAWTAGPVAPANDGVDMAEAMQAAWAARPAYVHASDRTEEAYAFAMAHPDILTWVACYCGCEAMGHRSNLDCFFEPGAGGSQSLQFEEHASYCQVCVDEALMAKRLASEGQSLRAIRDAIDGAFGGAAPGTLTDLPPA